MFPLVFVIIFLSSAFFPRALLTGPAEAVAAYNPISYLAEGMRGPIISGNSGSVELKAFAVGIGLTAFTSLISVLALRVRLGGSR
jgi:ABC-2 type transport system permease protein